MEKKSAAKAKMNQNTENITQEATSCFWDVYIIRLKIGHMQEKGRGGDRKHIDFPLKFCGI